MLKPIDQNLFIADASLTLAKQTLSIRMTVVRLITGGLVLISPIPFNASLKDQMNQLGRVEFIVAPNRLHHLYIHQWADQFPHAKVLVAPGLPQRIKSLRYDQVIGDTAWPAWQGSLQHKIFRALPILNEVVFFHSDSKTLILTDLCFHLNPTHQGWLKWYFQWSNAYRGLNMSRLLKWMITDKKSFTQRLHSCLDWDFQRIIVAHGDIVEHQAKHQFIQAFVDFIDPENISP